MNIWIASMECAGIIEAGGVKNVTRALCKEFQAAGNNTTLFIPVFKTNEWNHIKKYKENISGKLQLFHCGKNEELYFSTGTFKNENFKIVFLNHAAFLNKEAVYTYTENEQKQNPAFVKGTGHCDTLFMDALFAKSIALYSTLIPENELPQIVHCQDASTALVPLFCSKKTQLAKTKYVVTIHNAGPAYHHNYCDLNQAVYYTDFSEHELYGADNKGRVEPFLLAEHSGAYLTTVSEDYAFELKNPDYDAETDGLASIFYNRDIQIKGITNGIEYDRYNPSNKKASLLPYEFNPEVNDLEGKYKNRNYLIKKINSKVEIPDIKVYGNLNPKTETLIVFHGRITVQKGISLLIKVIPQLVTEYDMVSFLIMGQGQLDLENELIKLTQKYEGKVAFLNGYNQLYARLTNAAGDFIALPSYFEPCGLEDFISQIYGTLPVANKTGGLNKIINGKTGFLYQNNTEENLMNKLGECIELKKVHPERIKKLINQAALYVHKNYEWEIVARKKYLKYFKEILKNS